MLVRTVIHDEYSTRKLRRTPAPPACPFAFPIDGDPDIRSSPKRRETLSTRTDLMIWKSLNRERRVGGPFEGPETEVSVDDPWNHSPAVRAVDEPGGRGEERRHERGLDRPREQLPVELELRQPDRDKQPERRPAAGEMDVPCAVGTARAVLHGGRGDGHPVDLRGGRL